MEPEAVAGGGAHGVDVKAGGDVGEARCGDGDEG